MVRVETARTFNPPHVRVDSSGDCLSTVEDGFNETMMAIKHEQAASWAIESREDERFRRREGSMTLLNVFQRRAQHE